MLTGCREYRPRLIEMARGGAPAGERAALLAHVAECADCARVLDEQLTLSAALDSLAGEPLPEMPRIEARVLAEFDRSRSVPRKRIGRLPKFALLAAALAAVALVRLATVERRSTGARQIARVAVKAIEKPAASPASVVARPAATARARHIVGKFPHVVAQVRQAVAESEPFVQIPYTVPLSPEERATVVRMNVPVAALIAVGFNVSTPDAGGSVSADVLVSQDGRARAIRLSSSQEEER
ncbi:MAG TPA: zf-HC2 domain-containing protein [Bryobacteraceae bacterium]|nr:zf-HC2 domain-containing protein [Bryobacteraceae bacterium]